MSALANMATQLARLDPSRRRAGGGGISSSTGKLRAYLQDHGDADAETLRAAVGLDSTRLVWGLLKADMQCGRITRVGNAFHFATDEERRARDPELYAAIALVEARGYRVVKQ
ncbi:MAG TPA: hypothetical protein VIL30_06105, partial [Ramlibacter sp.]